MYNHERKPQYLAEKMQKADISTNLRGWFEQSEYFEEKCDTDVCEWNTSQIIEFMKYIDTPRIQVLVLMKNQFALYTDWCLMNRMVRDNQNHFRELNDVDLCQCVDIEKLRRYIFTESDIAQFINKLPNYSDKLLILGLYEGLTPKNMVDLKVSDIDRDALRLSDGRRLEVSNKLLLIVEEADKETSYMALSEDGRTYPCVETDTVFKPLARKNARGGTLMLMRRFRKCLDYLGLPEMNVKDIGECGRIKYIKELMQFYNTDLSTILEGDKRRMVEYRYGKIQNRLTYMGTYGKFISE